MLVAWVEQAGVWRVHGGMRGLANALAEVAGALGVEFHYQTEVARIEVQAGRIAAVHLPDGQTLRCRTLISNGDTAALGAGLLGPDLEPYFASECRRTRSLSAVTFCAAAKVTGLPLSHHNVFFGENYPARM
jgi:Phytoene dehydrogenase and related proteins